MKWRVSQRKKRADGVTGQSDFYIPKENRNTVRSIESARAHTTHPKKSHKQVFIFAVPVTRHTLRVTVPILENTSGWNYAVALNIYVIRNFFITIP